MTTQAAIRAGFTREILASGPEHDLHLLVRPDADLDGSFRAWDVEEGEFLTVNGWMFCCAEMLTDGQPVIDGRVPPAPFGWTHVDGGAVGC